MVFADAIRDLLLAFTVQYEVIFGQIGIGTVDTQLRKSVFINADSGLKLKFISLSRCVDLNLTVLQPANTAEMWMWLSKF